MIRRIQALNYRCLRHLDLSLDRFHVLAGPAGSGKSTLFDALEFLGDVVRDGPGAAVESRTGDFRDLVWGRSDGDQGFELAIEFDVPEECRELLPADRDFRVYRYELVIRGDRSGARIHWERGILAPPSTPAPTQETLFPDPPESPPTILATSRPGSITVLSKVPGGNDWFYRETDPRRGWVTRIAYGPYRSTLGSLPESEDTMPVANALKQFLEKGVRRVSLQGSAVGRACPPGVAGDVLAADGSNLAWVVKRLKEEQPTGFHEWLERVRPAVAGLRDIRVAERAEDRHGYLSLCYDGDLQVPSWMESTGTMRLLAIALLPSLPERGGVYLVDEPEAGIHPSALGVIGDSLMSAQGSQLLAATCSEELLGLIEPGDVLRFAKGDGGAIRVERVDEPPASSE